MIGSLDIVQTTMLIFKISGVKQNSLSIRDWRYEVTFTATFHASPT